MPVTQWEGRRHHDTDSVYPLPNDPTEHGRLDNQSSGANAFMFNRPFHALPQCLDASKKDGFKAIDVGCGTGIMTCLLGNAVKDVPGSKVYGLDLSRVPEDRHKKPGNVEYIQGDISKLVDSDPRLQSDSFDYVFSRFLVASVTSWPDHLSNLYRLLKPGGSIELQEPSLRHFSQSTGQELSEWKWVKNLVSILHDKNGTDLVVGEKLEEYAKAAGFVDVQVKPYFWPWFEEVWEEHPETQLMGIYSIREALDFKWLWVEKTLQDKGGFDEAEMKDIKEQYYEQGRVKSFHHCYVVWGRKPE